MFSNGKHECKKNNVKRWGIYSKMKNIDKRNFLIKDVIEKPDVKSAPSNSAVIGRYILSYDIFKKLKIKKRKGWRNTYYRLDQKIIK